jgi:hypothetical protein
MIGNRMGVGQPEEAMGAAAARSSEGRWPRICEERSATGALGARCDCDA